MNYDPSRTWDIPQTDITLPTDNGYFLYVKVPIAEEETIAEVFADEAHIDPMHDEGYIIYKQGYIAPPVDGIRQFSPILGKAKTGAQIKPSKVEITNSDAPSIADFTPYLKHGQYPSIRLWQTMEDGTESERQDMPNIARIDGNITSVTFGQLPEPISGFILIK